LEPGVGETLDSTRVTFALRTSGGPYVRARGLLLSSTDGDPAAFEGPLSAWLGRLAASATRRCGLAAQADSRRGHALGVVIAEALAELEPLPSQVEPGTRLSFRARLLVPATHAELSVLEPRGLPRALGVKLEGDRVSADFYVDTLGTHRLQLMVDRQGGPEPALEAWVGVGQALPTRPLAGPAPGEAAGRAASFPHEALAAMLNAARLEEGVPELKRDAGLDRIAQAHADGMRDRRLLAHDLGDGSPLWRVQEAQLGSRATGENLARAGTLVGAHRAIWASPSHRANLLAPHFDSVGIGVARDALGEWWVCELLADRL